MGERPTAAQAGGGPGPGLARLWAGWRTTYIARVSDDAAEVRPDEEGRSLFERILGAEGSDDELHVVRRGRLVSVVLNAYPYGSGHLLVVPNRAVAGLLELTPAEGAELWSTVTDAVAAVTAAYAPDGVNVGLNLGSAAGAGVPDHLHVHVVPRWAADANFMTSVAEARVLPEPLADTLRKVRAAWPA